MAGDRGICDGVCCDVEAAGEPCDEADAESLDEDAGGVHVGAVAGKNEICGDSCSFWPEGFCESGLAGVGSSSLASIPCDGFFDGCCA